MSKEPSDQRLGAEKGTTKRTSHHDWLAPVSAAAPCGPDLEYDHDFVVLFASSAPKHDVQYGSFVGSPDPVSWSEIERDCKRLMGRTKDIRLAVLYTRCRTRLVGAVGLAEGIGLLAAWLEAFAEQIHPQPDVDGERDASLEMRMNALQALADPEGLLADVREIVLTKAMLARLQVRDVERAFSHPRPVDALAPESVTQQLQGLRTEHAAAMAGFDDAIVHLAEIDAWCSNHLETHQPDLSTLKRLLGRLNAPTLETSTESFDVLVQTAAESAATSELDAATPPEPAATTFVSVPENTSAQHGAAPANREAALVMIRIARTWFENHEPSSPIPVLLRRAEQFVGKRYAEVVKAIPAELLAQWDEADGGE